MADPVATDVTQAPEAPLPVVVLGAGLTGLSAAFHLSRAGVAYRLLERAPFVGGHATTIEEDGYRFDRTGHLLHFRDPSLRSWVEELLPGELERIERRSAVFSHGVYTRYPFQSNTYGLPPEVVFECVRDFVAAAHAPAASPPRNFEEYCLQHFGAGISRHFMLPYNARLWGVPPDTITSEWCERFVPLPTVDQVLRGAFGLPSPELGYNAEFLYPRRGIGELPQAIASRVHVELERAPERIDAGARALTCHGEQIRYRRLISTIPLPKLVALIADAPEAVRSAAAKLRSTELYYLDVALRRPNPRPYHWIYVPEARFPFYRVGCYSHFSADLAPPSTSSLYVELADRSPPDLARLLPRVVDGLAEMGLIEAASDVLFARLRHLDFAYVIYDRDHRESSATVHRYLEQHGIVACGRYGAWNYSSMEDALAFGRSAAAQATEA